MVEAGCLGHARRKLVDLVRAKGSPVAGEGVKQIAALYRIERRIYGLPPASPWRFARARRCRCSMLCRPG